MRLTEIQERAIKHLREKDARQTTENPKGRWYIYNERGKVVGVIENITAQALIRKGIAKTYETNYALWLRLKDEK